MVEQLDHRLFLFLNSINSPFWDKVMNFMSLVAVWIPMYLAILIFLGIKYKKRFWIILLFIILAVVLSDQTSVFIKNAFDRPRPCHEFSLQGLVHLVNGRCGGMYGFVSSHATNSFTVALLSLLFIRNRWYTVFIIIWAAAVSYSRIYLGVHYPGDVLGGALLGTFIGWGVYKIFEAVDKRIYPPASASAIYNPC
jgi:undecaprenyl-diphosphatase